MSLVVVKWAVALAVAALVLSIDTRRRP